MWRLGLDVPGRWYVTVMDIHFLSRDHIRVAAGDFDGLHFRLYSSCLAGEPAPATGVVRKVVLRINQGMGTGTA